MAVAEDILKDPYFADLDIDLSQFSEEEKTVILGVMQKAKVNVEKQEFFLFSSNFLTVNTKLRIVQFFTLHDDMKKLVCFFRSRCAFLIVGS